MSAETPPVAVLAAADQQTIDYIEVDNEPVDPDSGDFDDSSEGEIDGVPVESTYGSEREENV